MRNKYMLVLAAMSSLTYAQEYNGFTIATDESFQFAPHECSAPNSIETVDGETQFTLNRGHKRCEIAAHYLMQHDTEFSIKFDFRVKSHYPQTDLWHSIFQMHQIPDKEFNESWRCPIMALEIHNGALSMFRRYDHSVVSTLGKWSCADDNPLTTIKSVTFFTDVPYHTKYWNTFELTGTLGLSGNECLTAKINDFTTTSCGPNKFNDIRTPFLKFGIYKPSGWDFYSTVGVTYRNVKFN